MKKFVRFVVEFKNWVSLSYTAAMSIFLVISWIAGGRNVEILTLFQIMLLAVVVTLLQFICFSGYVIKKMRYSLRLFVFIVPELAVVSLCALWFQWVPVGNAGAWVIFFASFLVCFVLICAGFELYFWVIGKKYDGLLGEYRSKKGKKP